jgi:hypothetical protein
MDFLQWSKIVVDVEELVIVQTEILYADHQPDLQNIIK